mmetsp:Transcript_45104/g.98002  ORF Transcript_45104/g.98002 Transcript_45104/m.98002 type:complete len:262 (-) Transcript_45104:18-803(-)
MPNSWASSNSRTSSSTNITRRRSFSVSWQMRPFFRRSEMKPALPSSPTALPRSGPVKNSLSCDSSSAEQMVCSLLLEMMPRTTPASLSFRSLGASIGALSQSSTCLLLRFARSPGEAVKVPSKSNMIATTLPEMHLSCPLGRSGLSGTKKFSKDLEGRESVKDVGRLIRLPQEMVSWDLSPPESHRRLLHSRISSKTAGGAAVKSDIADGLPCLTGDSIPPSSSKCIDGFITLVINRAHGELTVPSWERPGQCLRHAGEGP